MSNNFVRYLSDDGPRWGVVDGAQVLPLPAEYHTTVDVLTEGGKAAYALAADPDVVRLDLRSLHLLHPVPAARIYCQGANYRTHMIESGMDPNRAFNMLFTKSTAALTGPDDDIVRPPHVRLLDYEVELGIVIGTKASYIAVHDAPKHIAGYCLVNDVSEREFQLERGGQWTKGKSADTFCPMGPWLVTADEVPDPGKLQLWTEVNGERRQNSNTSDLIFGIDHIVSYVSHFTTLYPGDVIPTGTPSGVGAGFKPPRFLRPGDTMRLSVEGLGEQTQRLVAFQG